MKYSYKVKETDNFSNVKDVLKSYFFVSSRLITKLKNAHYIFLNDSNASLSDAVENGDIVSFFVDFDEDSSNIVPVKMDLDIVYEDDSFLIVNKPAFMAVHPTAYHFSDTLSNGVKFYFDSIGLHKKIRIVNRLDRNTSGLVIIAKNEYVQEFLIRQMKSFSINEAAISKNVSNANLISDDRSSKNLIDMSVSNKTICSDDKILKNIESTDKSKLNISNCFEKKYLGIVQGDFSNLKEISHKKESGIYYLHISKIDDSDVFIKSLCDKNEVVAGTIDLPIARKNGSIIERCVSHDGEKAITNFRIIREFNVSLDTKDFGILDSNDINKNKNILSAYLINKNLEKDYSNANYMNNESTFSLVEFSLETGRTHQIRVHTSYFGHPLLGDDLYGGDTTLINRQALHCYFVKFIHPQTREFVSFTAPLPEDFKKVLSYFEIKE